MQVRSFHFVVALVADNGSVNSPVTRVAGIDRGIDVERPLPRAIEPPEMGQVIAFLEVGGLHHLYARKMAA